MSEGGFPTNKLIGMVISLFLISILLPLGLNQLFSMTLPASADPSITTILLTVLPIMIVISIMVTYVPKKMGGK